MVHGARTDVLYSCARDLTIRQWRRSAAAAAAAAAAAGGGGAGGSSTSSPCTQVIKGGHDLNITALALSGDETLLCSGSRDTAVCLWDVATGERIVRKKTSRNLVTCMAWVTGGGGGEDASVVVQGSEDLKLRTWDMREGSISPSQTMVGYVYFPLCIDVSADGRYIATGSKGFDGVGCEVRVWDRRQGQLLCEMQGHRQSTVGCAFLHGGHTQLASVSKDQSIRLWDVGVEGVGREVFNDVGCTGGTFTCLSAAVAGTKTRLYAGSSSGFSVYDVAAGGGGEGLSAEHVQSWV
jgi:WD40 repeat protein